MSILQQLFVPLQNKPRKGSPLFNGKPLDPTENMPPLDNPLLYNPGIQAQPPMPPALPQQGPVVGDVAPTTATRPSMLSQLGGMAPATEPSDIAAFDAENQAMRDEMLKGKYQPMPSLPTLAPMPVRDVKGEGKSMANTAGIAGLAGLVFGGVPGAVAAARGSMDGMAPAQDYAYQAEANRVGQMNQEAMQRAERDRQAVMDANNLEAQRVGDVRFLRQLGNSEAAQAAREENNRLNHELAMAKANGTLSSALFKLKDAAAKRASMMVDENGEIAPEAYDVLNDFNNTVIANGFPGLAFQPDFRLSPDAKALAGVVRAKAYQQNADTKTTLADAQADNLRAKTLYTYVGQIPQAQARTTYSKVMAEQAPLRTKAMQDGVVLRGEDVKTRQDREARLFQKQFDEGTTPKVTPDKENTIRYHLVNAPIERSQLMKKTDPYFSLRDPKTGLIPENAPVTSIPEFRNMGVADRRARIEAINREWPKTKAVVQQTLKAFDEQRDAEAARIGMVRDPETGVYVQESGVAPGGVAPVTVDLPAPGLEKFSNIKGYTGPTPASPLGWKVTSYAEKGTKTTKGDTKDGNSEFGVGAYNPAKKSLKPGISVALTPGVKSYIDQLYNRDMKGQFITVIIEKGGKKYKATVKIDDKTSSNPALGDRMDFYNPDGKKEGDFPLNDGQVVAIVRGGQPIGGLSMTQVPTRVVPPKSAAKPKPTTPPTTRSPKSKPTQAEELERIQALRRKNGIVGKPLDGANSLFSNGNINIGGSLFR